MERGTKKILKLSFLTVSLLAGFLMSIQKAQAECEITENGQWCSRCSTIKACTFVTWYDKDGGCDGDWYNCRTETPNDSCGGCPSGQQCSGGTCVPAGQWCERCSTIKPCTRVRWYDRDGGCDNDWYNQRREWADDSCNRCPLGQECSGGKCVVEPQCRKDSDCPEGYVCHNNYCVQPCTCCTTCCCGECSPTRPGWKCVCTNPVSGGYLYCTGQEVKECCNHDCYEWKDGHCVLKAECEPLDCIQPETCGNIYQPPCPDETEDGKMICEPGCYQGLTQCPTPTGRVCLPRCDCKWPGENCKNDAECCENNCINGVCGGSSPPPPPPPPPPSNNPPFATDLKVTHPDYCVSGPRIILSWTFNDPDGDTQSAYRVQVATDHNFSSIEHDSGQVTSTSPAYTTPTLSYDNTYYWRVKVWDSRGAESLWSNVSSFSTPKHAYPTPDFTFTPEKPKPGEIVQFFDNSQVSNEATTTSWKWTFEDGNPAFSTERNPTVRFTSSGKKKVTLTVTDSDGFTCSKETEINVKRPFLFWEEVFLPNFSIRKILANLLNFFGF